MCACASAVLVRFQMATQIFRAIIMGPPGSGKGTISARIVKDFGMKHLSSGDIIRAQITKKTSIGIEADSYIKAGTLVPDEVMVGLVAAELHQLRQSSWLLDGFPRTVNQAKILGEKEKVDTVINLDVPFEVIINRIKGRMIHEPSGRTYHAEFNPPKFEGKDDVTGEDLTQRLDDHPDTVLSRLDSYQSRTQPVLKYYRKNNLLHEFRGNYSNELWPLVHKFLSSKTNALHYTEYT